MKKKLFYLSLILTVSILFSSCQATMMKRHYRKGYYVEHKKHHQNPGVVKNHTDNEALAAKAPPTLPSIKSELTNAEGQNEPEPTLKSRVNSKKSVAKQTEEKTAFNSGEKKNETGFLKTKLNRSKAVAEKVMGPESGLISATLSLFWIIIVVLLVFYLIGILFEGFGLGGLFHLMALVILILLILWLLGLV